MIGLTRERKAQDSDACGGFLSFGLVFMAVSPVQAARLAAAKRLDSNSQEDPAADFI